MGLLCYTIWMNTKQRLDVSHVGKKFGKLTVVSFSHRVKYKSGSSKKFWVCLCDCGNETTTDSSSLLSGRSRSCGCVRNRGGKINKDGYRFVYDRGIRKYVCEHRLVYENHYGVKLNCFQNVHHINGDRQDNRIENLELWDTSQPSGQRVEDKIEFYFKLIDGYKNHPLYSKLINPPYLSIMKSSYSTYSKSRKMGKKFNQRLRENEEVIKKVKGE